MTWLDVPADSPFPVQNLPYGVFSPPDEQPRVGVALGDDVLDLAPLAAAEGLDGGHVFESASLNPFMALGRPAWTAVRSWLTELLTHDGYRDLVESHLIPRDEVALHLPFEVADYVDFYSSEHHATNVGRLFRPDSRAAHPQLAAPPDRLPRPGRHGRGLGHRRRAAQRPAQGPRRRHPVVRTLDRVSTSRPRSGSSSGVPSELGTQVAAADIRDHVFGVCLVNDWSARDIQAWEYVPLGPFLGKSFATSVSPWVVPLDALDAARVAPPAQDPPVLPYLQVDEPWGLDLTLEVALQRRGGVAAPVRRHVLDRRAAAGPSHRQRRRPAHR